MLGAGATKNSRSPQSGAASERDGFMNRLAARCYRYNQVGECLRMSFPYRSLLGAAIVCVFLTGCSSAPQTAKAVSGKENISRKPAPDFTLKDANGATVH